MKPEEIKYNSIYTDGIETRWVVSLSGGMVTYIIQGNKPIKESRKCSVEAFAAWADKEVE